MNAPLVIRVRFCEECGRVCDSMDTRCPACLGYGRLRDRFQCTGCKTLLDERTCAMCEADTGIRAGAGASVPTPRPRLEERFTDSLPSFVDTSAPPPWLAGAVGGGVMGCGIGVVAGLMLGEALWLTGLLGLVPGILAGALLTSDKGKT